MLFCQSNDVKEEMMISCYKLLQRIFFFILSYLGESDQVSGTKTDLIFPEKSCVVWIGLDIIWEVLKCPQNNIDNIVTLWHLIGNYIFYILIRDNVLKHIQAPNNLAAFNDPDSSVHLLSNGGSLKEFRNVKNTSRYARNTCRYARNTINKNRPHILLGMLNSNTFTIITTS